MEDLIKGAINDIKASQDALNESMKIAAKEDPDVKDGRLKEEDVSETPASILFNVISETSIKLLQDDVVEGAFQVIGKHLPREAMDALVNLFAVTMTHSAYNAICFYDDLLKKELDKQIENIGHHVNLTKADVQAHAALIQIIRKELDDVSKVFQLSDLRKSTKSDNII